MNHEKILDALEFIDDDMIECVDALRKVPERPRLLWLKYVSVAACVVLAIFGGFKYFDGHFATQENSSAGDDLNNVQNGVIDIYGDANYRDESAEQLKTDDNTTFRDENVHIGGSTSGTIQTVKPQYTPAYLLITEIHDNGFKAQVIDVDKNRNDLKINQLINAVYDENAKISEVESLKQGDKVFVYYDIDKDNSTQITVYEITYEDPKN